MQPCNSYPAIQQYKTDSHMLLIHPPFLQFYGGFFVPCFKTHKFANWNGQETNGRTNSFSMGDINIWFPPFLTLYAPIRKLTTSCRIARCFWMKNSFMIFLIRFGILLWIFFLVPFALYLQQFGTEPVILHGICYVLARSPSILHGIYYICGTSTSQLRYLLYVGGSNVHVGFFRDL